MHAPWKPTDPPAEKRSSNSLPACFGSFFFFFFFLSPALPVIFFVNVKGDRQENGPISYLGERGGNSLRWFLSSLPPLPLTPPARRTAALGPPSDGDAPHWLHTSASLRPIDSPVIDRTCLRLTMRRCAGWINRCRCALLKRDVNSSVS